MPEKNVGLKYNPVTGDYEEVKSDIEESMERIRKYREKRDRKKEASKMPEKKKEKPKQTKTKDFKSLQEITDKITILSDTIAKKKAAKESYTKERNRRAYLYKKRKQLQPTTEQKVAGQLDSKKVKELPKKSALDLHKEEVKKSIKELENYKSPKPVKIKTSYHIRLPSGKEYSLNAFNEKDAKKKAIAQYGKFDSKNIYSIFTKTEKPENEIDQLKAELKKTEKKKIRQGAWRTNLNEALKEKEIAELKGKIKAKESLEDLSQKVGKLSLDIDYEKGKKSGNKDKISQMEKEKSSLLKKSLNIEPELVMKSPEALNQELDKFAERNPYTQVLINAGNKTFSYSPNEKRIREKTGPATTSIKTYSVYDLWDMGIRSINAHTPESHPSKNIYIPGRVESTLKTTSMEQLQAERKKAFKEKVDKEKKVKAKKERVKKKEAERKKKIEEMPKEEQEMWLKKFENIKKEAKAKLGKPEPKESLSEIYGEKKKEPEMKTPLDKKLKALEISLKRNKEYLKNEKSKPIITNTKERIKSLNSEIAGVQAKRDSFIKNTKLIKSGKQKTLPGIIAKEKPKQKEATMKQMIRLKLQISEKFDKSMDLFRKLSKLDEDFYKRENDPKKRTTQIHKKVIQKRWKANKEKKKVDEETNELKRKYVNLQDKIAKTPEEKEVLNDLLYKRAKDLERSLTGKESVKKKETPKKRRERPKSQHQLEEEKKIATAKSRKTIQGYEPELVDINQDISKLSRDEAFDLLDKISEESSAMRDLSNDEYKNKRTEHWAEYRRREEVLPEFQQKVNELTSKLNIKERKQKDKYKVETEKLQKEIFAINDKYLSTNMSLNKASGPEGAAVAKKWKDKGIDPVKQAYKETQPLYQKIRENYAKDPIQESVDFKRKKAESDHVKAVDSMTQRNDLNDLIRKKEKYLSSLSSKGKGKALPKIPKPTLEDKPLKLLNDSIKAKQRQLKTKKDAQKGKEKEFTQKFEKNKEKITQKAEMEQHHKRLRELADKGEKERADKKEMNKLSEQSLGKGMSPLGDPREDFERLKKVYEYNLSKKLGARIEGRKDAQRTLYDMDKYSNAIFRRMKRLGKKGVDVKGFIDRVKHNQKEFKKQYNQVSSEPTKIFRGIDRSNIRMKLKPDLHTPVIMEGIKTTKKPERLRIKPKEEYKQQKLDVKKRPKKEAQSLRKQLKASLSESKKASELNQRQKDRKERIQAREKDRIQSKKEEKMKKVQDRREKEKEKRRRFKPTIKEKESSSYMGDEFYALMTQLREAEKTKDETKINRIAVKMKVIMDEKLAPQKEEVKPEVETPKEQLKEEIKEEVKAEVMQEIKVEKEKEQLKEEVKKEVMEEVKKEIKPESLKDEEKPEPEKKEPEPVKEEEKPKEEKVQPEEKETGYESVSTEELDEKIKKLKAEREQTSNQGLKQKVNELRKQRGQKPEELKKTGKIWVKEGTRKGRTVKGHYRERPQRA